MPLRMTRRAALVAGLRGLGAGLAATRLASRAEAAPGRRANVLFIAVDDLRPQLACYGHKQMVSPRIDALAAGGVLFERAYCQIAICAPSRASVLSGVRPDTMGFYFLNTPLRKAMPRVVSLPQHFRANGYTTLSLGKIYHHSNDDAQGWSETPWHPANAWPGSIDPKVREAMRRYWRAKPRPRQRPLGPSVEAADVADDAYADGRLTAKAIGKLRQVADKPFFLAVGYVKPHLAFACPKKYWDLYKRDDLDLADNPFRPKGCPDVALHNWGELRTYSDIPKSGPLTDAKARELIHGYYACTSFIDAQVGRLLDELDRLELADNTVVVLWGDHGWNLGEHGLWCKHCNFETSVHVPLIIRAPGAKGAGKTTPALAEFVDVYPTLCELCGLGLPEPLEGVSLAPLLANPSRPWKTAAFSQYQRGSHMGYSMRTARYRFTRWQGIKNPKDIAGLELYDHQTDPGENVNLAAQPQHKALVERLGRMLDAGWRAAKPPQERS